MASALGTMRPVFLPKAADFGSDGGKERGEQHFQRREQAAPVNAVRVEQRRLKDVGIAAVKGGGAEAVSLQSVLVSDRDTGAVTPGRCTDDAALAFIDAAKSLGARVSFVQAISYVQRTSPVSAFILRMLTGSFFLSR